ncbi:MAG TPA: hypothetical protein VFJ97_04115 [Dermatophilaceae bacterium]|nr:hypothetical protein [Dermatophilaceae bacterium]
MTTDNTATDDTDTSRILWEAWGLVSLAYRQALVQTRVHPDSTWIDSACAIGAAEAQLLTAYSPPPPTPVPLSPAPEAGLPAPPGVADGSSGPPAPASCSNLLDAAEQALARIPAGHGPPVLPLIRVYLADAIAETAGRER